ncbi:MAG: ABC transporter substrate-binding protein [Actinomycetota bacterium]
MTRSRLQLVALVGVMVMVAAACGQKEGVALQTAAGGQIALPEGASVDAAGNIVDAEGKVIGTVNEGIFGAGTTGSTTTGGTTGTALGGTTGTTGSNSNTGTENGGSDDGSDDGDKAPPPSSGGNTTGIEGDVIKIGIHAPITGAAPVPSASFDKGKDLYWDFIGKSVNGREVEVVFRNDNYNPSQAVSGCREMVEEEKVFLLIGIAGTDQIQACARYAATVGVPYISAGVTEIGLDTLQNYFAIWMSYPQQGPLLADLLTTKLGAKDEKNGMVRFNTPTFQDGHDTFIAAMNDAGAEVAYDRAVSKTSEASTAQTIATELNQQGIQNVHVLVSPLFFIQLSQAAASQRYFPQYVGYGLTKGLDTVANAACKNSSSIQNARFLSPFPAFVDSNRFDPDFREAGGTDDIMLGLWGTSKVVAEMLKAPGKDLSRERFIAFAQEADIKTGVFPDVSFSPSDHFGGTAMHLLRADCPNNRFVTEQAFVRDF